jgi:hypothetical protein
MKKLSVLIKMFTLAVIVFSCATKHSNVFDPTDGQTWIPADSGDIFSIRIEKVNIIRNTDNTRDLIEFSVGLNNMFNLNPFKSDDIAIDAVFFLPDGKKMSIPAFYFRGYTLKEDGIADPDKSTDGWRIRLSAKDTGKYNLSVVLKVKGKVQQETEGPSFIINKRANHGLIRIPEKSKKYFEYEDGTTYFPIGENMCFPTETEKRIFSDYYVRENKSGWENFKSYWTNTAFTRAPMNTKTYSWDSCFRRWMSKLHENGGNCIRFWMFNMCYLEGIHPSNYNLERAWRMDYIVNLAETNDIHMIVCFDFDRGYSTTDDNWCMMFNERSAYCRLLNEKGIKDPAAILDFDMIRELSYDRYRYIVGRWGYSTSIFSWEIWNEYECVVGDAQKKIDWMKKSTALLREVDTYDHLIKSSSHRYNDWGYWGNDCGDFNDVHPYYGWFAQEMGKDFSEMIIHYTDYVHKRNLPFMIAEGGAAREVVTDQFGMVGFQTDKDKRQINLHDVLWSGVFSGSAGSGMAWWWDEQVDLPDAYFWFRGLSNFAKNVEWTKEEYTPAEPEYYEAMDLRIRRMMGKTSYLIWLQNLNWTWWNVAQHQQQIVPVKATSVSIRDVIPGSYEIEYWDTEKGAIINKEKAETKDTVLIIPIPEINTDMALKIKRI